MDTFTITFTDDELQALGVLLDAGVRYDGLKTVHAASAILRKIEAVEADLVEESTEEGGA